jgi:hypothetical protein
LESVSERRIKAVAGALGPKSHDLTQYRRRSIREGRHLRVKSEDASGALAFSAREDALGAALLRFKYAEQRNKGAFTNALELLLRRHGWDAKHPSITLHACAVVTLFEWSHDQCPECRGPRKTKTRGMHCTNCSNSGRKAFRFKQRFALVNDYVMSAGMKPLKLTTFQRSWEKVYLGFLRDLRDVDRTIAQAIDLGFYRMDNRATVPDPRETVAEPEEDEAESAEQAPVLAPEQPTGKLPPTKT